MIKLQIGLWLLYYCLCHCATAHWLFHPLDQAEFLANWYGKDHLLVPRPADYYPTELGLDSSGWLCRHADAVRLRERGISLPGPGSCAGAEEALANGYSAMFRLEDAQDPDPQLRRLLGDFVKTTGFRSTLHVYYGGSNSTGFLAPHTDPYDVFVLQIEGIKHWKLCVPTSAALQVRHWLLSVSTCTRPL